MAGCVHVERGHMTTNDSVFGQCKTSNINLMCPKLVLYSMSTTNEIAEIANEIEARHERERDRLEARDGAAELGGF